jgi:mycothiol synthase
LNQDLTTRAATDADAAHLCTFLNACTLAYQGIARFSPDDARTQLHQADADPQHDSFVVSGGGEIVGFAHVWLDTPDELKFFARTHPGAQGRGVGSLLVDACDRRADELLPGGRRTTTTWAADAAGPPLLEAHGYRDVRHYLRMEIEAHAVLGGEPSWPEGVECGRFSDLADHERPLYDAWLAAFATEWGSYDESEEAFWRERRDDRGESAFPFDPTLWLVACAGGEVVGFCLCELGASEGAAIGRVAEIGALPSRRGQGLGTALLHAGLLELRRRGADRIVLDVDAENVTTALRLYTSAGMTPKPSFTIWEKETGKSLG